MNVWNGKPGRPGRSVWTGVSRTVISTRLMRAQPGMIWRLTGIRRGRPLSV